MDNASPPLIKPSASDAAARSLVDDVMHLASDGRTLLEAEGHLWSFCRVEGVEPTNNAAERALRPAVLWRKASQGTRSDLGSRYVATMLSVAATCKQQSRRVWDYLTQTFASRAAGHAAPSLLQMS